MWSVIVTLKSIRTGELTEMSYLSIGNDIETAKAAVMAIAEADNDPQWVTTQAIRIERVRS